MRVLAALLWVTSALGCAHRPLSGHELDRLDRPAFISRIEDDAGPESTVFRDDRSYSAKLKKLGAREADRRLVAKLARGATRFAVADRLRAGVFEALQGISPYDNAVDPARVASALETFLVEEVPADPPDYELLEAFGTDAIIEFVIEDYGMRSAGGRAGVYLKGFARMFRLEDRRELWCLRFSRDEVAEKADHLDPFLVGQQPQLFGTRMARVVDELAERFARELNPPDRGLGGRTNKPGSEELEEKSDDTNRTGREPPPPKPEDELPPGELPPPD